VTGGAPLAGRSAKLFNPAVFALIAVAIGAYYLWGVRAAGYEFVWGQNPGGGYYDYLGRAFAGGHLYLPIEPAPQLLAQPNPWDPAVDDSLKLFDAVLFNRRYYLYHAVEVNHRTRFAGEFRAVPAVLRWLPLFRRRIPEYS
jgi:hypothetical protein